MLIKPTQERLRAMRLSGMAEAFAAQMEDTGAAQLSFEERFALLVDRVPNDNMKKLSGL